MSITFLMKTVLNVSQCCRDEGGVGIEERHLKVPASSRISQGFKKIPPHD